MAKITETKVCLGCKQTKKLSAFHKNKTYTSGRENWCKVCRYEQAKKHNQDYPDVKREHSLKWHYGLTMEDYNNMLEGQNRVCAICGNIDCYGRRLSVDHDHNTGEIRGLLCSNCNQTLGWAHDNPRTLRKAADYLEGR